MKPNISEFSYGYAITDELINWHGTSVTAAPVFPSLIEEGGRGGGYDLRLDRPGLPLFLQFKLTDYIKRFSVTEEYAKGLFISEFYRMHLRPLRHSQQHKLLLQLERKKNEVYYAAPAFHEVADFNVAYLNKQILTKSILVAPSYIGALPDNKDHRVSFQMGGSKYVLSTPVEIRAHFGEEFTHRISERFWQVRKNKTPLSENLPDLYSQMLGILRDIDVPKIPKANASIDVLRQVSYLARTFFDCEFLIVSEKPSN